MRATNARHAGARLPALSRANYDARMSDPPAPPNPASIPPEVLAHYNLGLESTRLTAHPLGALELERIQSVLRRHLPPAPARILDLCGGSRPHRLPPPPRGSQVPPLHPV